MRVLLIWWAILVYCGNDTIAGQEPASPPYYLLEVENRLQKKLAGDNVDHFLLFDASEFWTESNKVNERSVTLQAIRSFSKQLDDNDAPSSTIVATAFISAEIGLEKPAALQSFFKKELASGRVNWKLRTLIVNGKQTFQQYVHQQMSDDRDESVPNAARLESAFVKTEHIIVYPVYTRLSRLLTGNASCHVEVVADLNSLSEHPGCEVLASDIKTAIKSLELMDHSKIVFEFHGELDPKQLEVAGTPLKLIGFQEGFVVDLGFEHSSVVIR